jgi:SAM-dependent methyltransferase
VPNTPEPLVLTGERTLPGIWHERYWYARHEVAYRWVGELLAPLAGPGTRVLDAGCGEGYGAAYLAETVGARVVGVDYDAATAAHARRRYPGLRVVRGNLVALGLTAGCFDAVVSLQTVEHLWDQPGFTAECARVLRTGGVLVVSTPNRLTFSPGVGRGQAPVNPFHVNELDPGELIALLAAAPVHDARMLGVHHGPRIDGWQRAHGSLVEAMLARPYHAWGAPLAAFARSMRAEDFVVAAESDRYPLERSLDLLAVARGAVPSTVTGR